jgi:hypothetical protein
MSVGFRRDGNEPPKPVTLLRTLWRMQGPRRIVTAALYKHPAGTELPPSSSGPRALMTCCTARSSGSTSGVLDERAEALRAVLLEKGWRDAD